MEHCPLFNAGKSPSSRCVFINILDTIQQCPENQSHFHSEMLTGLLSGPNCGVAMAKQASGNS